MASFDAILNKPESNEYLLFEDDGEVAYAYFSSMSRGVTGFVWLYNRKAPPEELEERGEGQGPLNAKSFVLDVTFRPVMDASELQVIWRKREEVDEAALYIRGKLHAVVGDGDKPGWSILATRDSPVAKSFHEPTGGHDNS